MIAEVRSVLIDALVRLDEVRLVIMMVYVKKSRLR